MSQRSCSKRIHLKNGIYDLLKYLANFQMLMKGTVSYKEKEINFVILKEKLNRVKVSENAQENTHQFMHQFVTSLLPFYR